MRLLFWLGLCSILAGCTAIRSFDWIPDFTTANPEPGQLRDIAPAASRINLGLEGIAPVSRRGRQSADRYEETLVFRGGWVRYETLLNFGGFTANSTSIARIQGIVDSDWYRRQDFTRPTRDFKTVVNRYGTAQYALVENRLGRCAVFAQYFWTGESSPSLPGDTEVTGSFCQPPVRAATVERLIVTLVQTLRVGEGVNAPSVAVLIDGDLREAPDLRGAWAAAMVALLPF